MQELERTGLWWLPASPTRRLAGTLRFSLSEGLRLEIVGDLAEDPGSRKNHEVPPVVLGQVLDDGLVTLIECDLTGLRFNRPYDEPRLEISEYRAVVA